MTEKTPTLSETLHGIEADVTAIEGLAAPAIAAEAAIAAAVHNIGRPPVPAPEDPRQTKYRAARAAWMAAQLVDTQPEKETS